MSAVDSTTPTLNEHDLNSSALADKELAPTEGVTKTLTGGDASLGEKAVAHELYEQEQRNVDRDARLLTGYKLALVFVAMMLSVLLIALDQTIVATALPVIASQFDALSQITWIVSAYFLTQAPFILVYGQLLRIFPTKWVFLVAVSLFEIGSLFCGVAPTCNFLIFGRAFAGVGAAGIFVSVLSIIAEITTLEQRPTLFGLFGVVFGISSVIGPLLGGVFTERVTWRLCFYINLPVGLITLVAIFFLVKATPPHYSAAEIENGDSELKAIQRVLKMDWLGGILILGITTCLIIALQEGGITKPWNDKSIIAEFCVFGVLLVLFVLWERRRGERAIFPLRLFSNRTVTGACAVSFFLMSVMLISTYYLPLFYQAVKGHSAEKSGIDIIPFMLSLVLSAMVSGGIISTIGYYLPFLLIFPMIFAPLGGGLLYMTTIETSTAKLIGFQILLGIGVGAAFQNTVIAIQADYHEEPEVIPQATALGTFFQLIGGVIGVSIAGTVFNNQLATNLTKLHIEQSIINAVKLTVEAIFTLDANTKAIVLDGYVSALDTVFIIAVPAGILSSLSALLIRNHNIKKMGMQMGAAA